MKNIVIDGLNYFFNQGEYGIYVRDLIDGLFTYSKCRVTLLKDENINGANSTNLPVKLINFNRIKDNISYKAQVFHCFNNGFYIYNEEGINIMSISSLLPLLNESIVDNSYLKRFYEKFEKALNLSTYITVSSYYQKDKLSTYYNIDDEKIKILYPFVSDGCKYGKVSKAYLKSKDNLKNIGDYLLFSGDLHKRKNIEEVLFFFSNLKKQTGINDKLVIATYSIHNDESEKNYLKELEKLAGDLLISKDTIFLSMISKADEYHLIKMAKKFIDLSTSCDFNLSIIRAFVCDTDIICTDIDVYREYLEDYPSYYYFNTDDIPRLYLEDKSELEKEKFDYLKDKFKCKDSLYILQSIYENL